MREPAKDSEDEEMNPRSCMVSRQAMDRNDLIRFVAGPDGTVVPDLKENLPGRGVRVEMSRKVLETAIRKKLFSRGLKQQVMADENLPELVDSLLEKHALQAFAMAKKAGHVITGFAKVDAALRANKADMVLHASDCAEDGKRKIASAISFVRHMGGDDIPVLSPWSADQMSAVLGLGNVNHVAILPGGAGRNLTRHIARLERYRGDAKI